MKQLNRYRIVASCLLLLLGWSGGLLILHAQNIQVSSANPPAAPQDTTNLNVTIGGNGFKLGARAVFYLSGTTNPDGIVVNSTTFKGSSQLVANINVALNATISNFDILVQNSDGRTGKGTELFAVTAKGTPIGCTTLGTPSAFSLLTTLNGLNPDGTAKYMALGATIQVRPVVVTAGTQSRTVLVAAVGTTAGKLEIFILDPVTGQLLDGQSLLTGSPVQSHITVVYDPTGTIGSRVMAAGDVNGDGVPDFAAGSRFHNVAFAFVGSMDKATGILSYSFSNLPPPASSPGQFGMGVTMGNLDGSPGDEVVVGAGGGGTGGSGQAGKVFTFKFNSGTGGFDLIGSLDDPLPNAKKDDLFGSSVAVSDVTGDASPDLIVGASSAIVNGVTGSGRVFVFPGPLSSLTYFTLSTSGIKNDHLGYKVGAGNVNGVNVKGVAFADVIASTAAEGSDTKVAIFSGPIAANSQSPNLKFSPFSKLSTTGWATGIDVGDMLGDGQVEVLVGVPNASNSTSVCTESVGAAEVYFPSVVSLAQPTYVFQPPTINPDFDAFGWSVAAVPATAGNPPLLVVGEIGRTIGGVRAGQVYVYKKN